MKKYMSKVFTIFVSGALIASTLLISEFGSFDANHEQLPIENTTTAKSGDLDDPEDLIVSKINVDKIFGKFSMDNYENENDYYHENNEDAPDSLPTLISTTTASVAATTAASASTTASSTSKTSAATIATTAKAPEDESKNIKYIKDPDYKSKYYVVVYTGSQSVVVYGKDDAGAYNVKIKVFTVSTGRIGSTPTREGVYKIRAKYRWRMLMGPCWGQWCSSISSSYLFHSVPYDKKSPDTLYNASYNNLGKAVSHGCIRMCVRDCKWIYDNCPIGTQVHVVWASGPAGPGVPKRKSGSKYSGWDPSDQWSKGNPYFADSSDSDTSAAKTTTAASSTTTTSKASSTTTTSTASSTQSTSTSSSTTASTSAAQTTTTSAQTTTKTTTKPSYDSSDNSDDIPVG